MAVSRKTQKDIGKYQAKLIGPFTTRQVVCIAIGMIPTVIIEYFLHQSGKVDVYSMFGIALILMVIPCFFGFGQKLCHGQKPEDYIRDYYFYHVLAPKVRYHEVESYDDILEAKEKKSESTTESVKQAGNSRSRSNKTGCKRDKEYPYIF